MRIGIAFDLAPTVLPAGSPDDVFEEFDKATTVEALADVISGEGHDVVLLGNGRDLLVELLDDVPDFVWNMAEGRGVGRDREARVPAVLEMLGIPYTGSDPFTLCMALDKAVAKRLVVGDEVLAPGGDCLPPGLTEAEIRDRLGRNLTDLDFPAIIKPAFEGSSKGIRCKTLAQGIEEAARLIKQRSDDYAQPCLIEPYIQGDEITVGLVGNGSDVAVIGVMRVVPNQADPHFVYSLEVKRDWQRLVRYETPAQLDPAIMARIERVSRLIFQRLGCRDLARIDFRVRDGLPYFLEANPLPGLAPGVSDLVILAEGSGLSYAALIRRILAVSLRRVGLEG